MRARKLCAVTVRFVAAPINLARHGEPLHPSELTGHRLLGYLNVPGPWRLSGAGDEEVVVRPAGPLSANSGESMVPALIAGLGIACLPDFIVDRALTAGTLVEILADGTPPPSQLYLITLPSPLSPARVEVLIIFLSDRLRGG